jgi:uncharacterized membrane protein
MYLAKIMAIFFLAVSGIGALSFYFSKIITPYSFLGRIYHPWGIIVIPVITVLVSAASIVTFVRRKTFLQ